MRIWVTVKPRSHREEMRRVAEGEWAASVRAPASEGKANAALVELVARHFSVPKSAVRILRGQGGRRKLLEIPLP